MIYKRAERFGAKAPNLTKLKDVTPKQVANVVEEVVEESIDLETMEWKKLQAYAKEQGVDIAVHKSRVAIIEQLTK